MQQNTTWQQAMQSLVKTSELEPVRQLGIAAALVLSAFGADFASEQLASNATVYAATGIQQATSALSLTAKRAPVLGPASLASAHPAILDQPGQVISNTPTAPATKPLIVVDAFTGQSNDSRTQSKSKYAHLLTSSNLLTSLSKPFAKGHPANTANEATNSSLYAIRVTDLLAGITQNANQNEPIKKQTRNQIASSIHAHKDSMAKEKFVVVIDPGHGGSDPGSIGHNGLQEKEITLAIAKQAALFLNEIDDISVVLTRDKDKGLSRKSRVARVKQANADLVVSLHLNHLPQAEINLVETYYAGPENIMESIETQRLESGTQAQLKTNAAFLPDTRFTAGSRLLADLMQRRVYEEVARQHPQTDNAGVKKDTLYILTRSFTPGVLIEMSCLSNHEEANRLTDRAYINRLAAALDDGVRDYRQAKKAKNKLDPGV